MISNNVSWQFIDTGARDGRFNMDFDLMLVEKCRAENIATFRLYRWNPYAISIGYNQDKVINEIQFDIPKCRAEKIDIVTRPTGGRAVFHSEEITYSAVFRSGLPSGIVYQHISSAIALGLKKYHKNLSDISLTNNSPDLIKLIKKKLYSICFNTQVKNEINWSGRKLVGSAQRKFGDIILQHGSILTGRYHVNIVDYLNIDSTRRIEMKNEIEARTVSVSDITKEKVNYEKLSDCLCKAFAEYFNIRFVKINRLTQLIGAGDFFSELIMN